VFTTALSDAFALPKTATMLVLTVLLLPGLLLLGLRRGALSVGGWSVATIVLAVYLILTVAATVHSADSIQSLIGERLQYQGLLATLAYVVAFVAARAVLVSEERIRALALAVVVAATIASLYGLVQQVRLDPIWHVLDRGRIFSTLGQANALAAYLVLALPLAVAVGLASNGRVRRLALLAAAVLIAIAIAFTLSRGGYLGALVAMGALGAFLVRRSMLTPRRARLVAACAVIVVGMVSLVPPVTASFNQVVQRASKTIDLAEGSASSHLDLWAVGIRMATDYPVLGMGPEMYPVLFPQYRNRVLSPARAAVMARFRPESPHNVPIAIAAGAGLPALLAYLAIVMSALVAGWRRLRIGQSLTERLLIAALLAAALGHLTTDLFMTGEVAGSWTFWILLGVLTADQSHPPPREGEVSSAPGMSLG
jgi:O-antigen ligase